MSERPDLGAWAEGGYSPDYAPEVAAELARLRNPLPLEKWAAENGWLRPEKAVQLREELARLSEALRDDRSRWSFWTLVFIARRLLEAEYPPDIFVGDGRTGDPGPRFVAQLRAALAALPESAREPTR